MNDIINKKNMYENHLGPASDYKTREFLQSEKSELAKNLDKNSIKEEFEKIRMIEPYKSNYERKKEIIEYNAIWNTEQKKLKEGQREKDMLMRKIRDVSESEKDTIINKIIIIECTDKLLEFYNDKEISEDKIKANIEEIENGLNCDNLDKRQLYGIAKILIGRRYNFDEIILEEGKNGEYIYEKKDGNLAISENERDDSILRPQDKVLVRHLEGNDIKMNTMRTAMKKGLDFYDEHFKEYIQEIAYIKSESRLWNMEFQNFYNDHIARKEGNIKLTLDRMVDIGGKSVIYESSQEDNDRFLRFKKIDANGKIQNISKKSNKENIEALVKWTKEKKISKDVITPEIAERLIVEWNDKHEVQINSLLLGRAVYGEISSTIRLLPIENLKKDLSGMQDIDSNRKEVIDTYLHNLDETYGKLEKISNSPQLEECKRNAKSYIEKGLEPDFNIDVRENNKMKKLSKGERFIFDTSTGKHIKMDIGEIKDLNRINKKELEYFKNINNIGKSDKYIQIHRDAGANLTEFIDILYKMKVFLDIYRPREKIRYCFSMSRLQNSDFIEYYRKRLKDNKIDKPSNIIKVYDETRNYLAKQGRFQNTRIEGGYQAYKDWFILKDKDPTKPSSLNQALTEYEKEGGKLGEGCIAIDLDKIKKIWKNNA